MTVRPFAELKFGVEETLRKELHTEHRNSLDKNLDFEMIISLGGCTIGNNRFLKGEFPPKLTSGP